MHAVDPLQRLRLLERRLDALSDLGFHTDLSAIFRSPSDLRTVYQLTDAYRGRGATLGFLLERYDDEHGEQHYLVSRIDPALAHAGSLPPPR
jgi:hypothetical protein